MILRSRSHTSRIHVSIVVRFIRSNVQLVPNEPASSSSTSTIYAYLSFCDICHPFGTPCRVLLFGIFWILTCAHTLLVASSVCMIVIHVSSFPSRRGQFPPKRPLMSHQRSFNSRLKSMGLGDTWLFHSSSDARLNFYSLHKKSDLDMKAYAGEAIACIFLHSGAESVITLLFLKDGSQERGCSVLMRRDHGVVFRPCSQPYFWNLVPPPCAALFLALDAPSRMYILRF